jgi:RNA polymerase sigma factor (sigma-70 family)
VKSYQPYNDGELVRMLRDGNRMAFDTLYERHWLGCIDKAYQRLKDKQASEDIVQNLFVRLWTKRHELQIDNLIAYLNAGIRNGVINYVTRDKMPVAFGEPFDQIQMKEGDYPDAKLLEKDLLELILAYSQTLSPRPREIFLLHIQQKLTTKEIAEKLNISQKAVQNQLRTALLDLQSQIGPGLLLLVLAFGNSNITI